MKFSRLLLDAQSIENMQDMVVLQVMEAESA